MILINGISYLVSYPIIRIIFTNKETSFVQVEVFILKMEAA